MRKMSSSQQNVLHKRRVGKIGVVILLLLCLVAWWRAASTLYAGRGRPQPLVVDAEAPLFAKCADRGGLCACPQHRFVRFGSATRRMCKMHMPFKCIPQVFGLDDASQEGSFCECSMPTPSVTQQPKGLASDAPCFGTLCQNYSPECDLRSQQGECVYNPAMHASCSPACQLCGPMKTELVAQLTKKGPDGDSGVKKPSGSGAKAGKSGGGNAKTGIMVQVDKMFDEPTVDPAAMRKQAAKAYPNGKRPNPSPASCTFRHDGTEQLLGKAELSGVKSGPRIMCLVYTMHKKGEAMDAIRATYGPECDGLVFMGTETHPEQSELQVFHEGPEEYNNMWQKSRSIWAYVAEAERRVPEHDWFVIGGDDLYVVVENLRRYVASDEIREAGGGPSWPRPLFLGRRFQQPGGTIFNSGGAGYVMNRAALKLLADNLDSPSCHPSFHSFSEDREVGLCLQTKGVFPYDTKDSAGEERFMPFAPDLHLAYRAANYKKDWYKEYSIGLKEGMEAMSKEVVSFHYLKPDLMRRVHALLFHCRAPRLEVCANEGGHCKCSHGVRYGPTACVHEDAAKRPDCKELVADSAGPFDGQCANAAFGRDPAPGKQKICICTESETA